MKSQIPLATTLALATTLCAVSAFVESPWWGNSLEAQLQQAGTNRAALVSALEKTPAAQREGMQFLIVNMPERDLVSLSADFLLENVALAYESWEKSPWAKQISRAMFLNEIQPYANVSEERDNWRARSREIALPLMADCTMPANGVHGVWPVSAAWPWRDVMELTASKETAITWRSLIIRGSKARRSSFR